MELCANFFEAIFEVQKNTELMFLTDLYLVRKASLRLDVMHEDSHAEHIWGAISN
jgi:hypothetical protein